MNMPVLETLASKALLTLTTSIVKKFTDFGWTKIADEISASFDENSIRNYCNACEEYINIRTLYSSQCDVFIDDVYVPLFMSPMNDPEQKFEITNLNFYSEGITSIIGRAGQGKSTFLRKMLINEFKNGRYLPVFFELKYFGEGQLLIDLIVDWFGRHNVSTNKKGIERLFKSGYIKLFLDGFDEMPPSIREEALGKIKDFSRLYPKTTIIVTTRPDTIITTEPFVSNYQVLDLEVEHIRLLFENISCHDLDSVSEAMAQIENNPNIKKVAATPILAILLFLTFKAWSKIPDNLSDFYKKVFLTLLTHHDSLKPGKKIDRGIDIPLNDFQIEEVFSNFSFLSFSEEMYDFTHEEASKFAEIALDEACYDNVEPTKLINIIKQCTGILCNNGYDKIVYSHKSLQEYFTSVYIARQDLDDKAIFYKECHRGDEETKYKEVLAFLSGIDTKEYTKYYHIPCFNSIFDPKDIKNVTRKEWIKGAYKVMEGVHLSFTQDILDHPSVGLAVGKAIDKKASNIYELKIFHPIVMSVFATNSSKMYVENNHETLVQEIDKLDKGDGVIVPLIEVLDVLPNNHRLDFEKILIEIMNRSIVKEHEALIDFCFKKERPSLLKTAFKRKKDSESIIA
ncbi:NACHT domain-containing protein [Shewanella abyssi]|uniref:NACHT domain-containing protein n=1 Tax=Shewanella abyssi TaxID=311789 RepID=UPI0020109648|nr:NACHT domain-containing protein [Shewanella abyssi]MCL1048903.1 NACHT domain-containing protein [Shewanella abyssi]